MGVTHGGGFSEVSCQGPTSFDPALRRPNVIGNIFNSEVGLFRTHEGGLCPIIICGSQREYLEAGLLRGEYAGYNRYDGLGEDLWAMMRAYGGSGWPRPRGRRR